MTTREVLLDGGSPWGFRMHGGAEVQQPLRISRVNPGSKAANKGVREGDIITSINGQTTREKTNAEAHALLKGVGDTLRLGLNEDCNGSPKRRQYKTHQETHSETFERSNVSSYTSKTTTKNQSEFQINIDKSATSIRTNGDNINLNGDSKPNTKEIDITSERSTLSSNCSSSASTPSTLTDTKGGEKVDSTLEDNTTHIDEFDLVTADCNAMADNVIGNSRSRRRRRSNKTKSKKASTVSSDASAANMLQTLTYNETATSSETTRVFHSECENLVIDNATDTFIVKDANAVAGNLIKEEVLSSYRVESPTTLPKLTNDKKTKTVIKSKSLDDDESIKIQELSETSETEDKYPECNAIVAEVESDVEWEVTEQLVITEQKEQVKPLDTLSLKLEECTSTQSISIEDESGLRSFLENLNLVTSPEEAVRQAYGKQTSESIKAKRAKKREELAQYFLPVYQNPRYLDVIREEMSDNSDREQKYSKQESQSSVIRNPHLSDNYETPKNLTKEQRMQTCYYGPVSEKFLLSHKPPIVSEDICSTSIVETSSGVEVVYLEDDDSTNSATPSDFDESENFADGEDEDSRIDNSLTPCLSDINIQANQCEVEIIKSSDNIHIEKIKLVPLSQLTPPPTPNNISPTNFFARQSDTIYNNLEQNYNETHTDFPPETPPVAPAQYTNAVSPLVPSRASSICSESSSSRGTSLCTIRSNTLFSEGDIDSVLKDDLTEAHKSCRPHTLRDLCLNKLISLPFGADVLQELAEVSQNLEELTFNLSRHSFSIPGKQNNPALNLPAFPPKASNVIKSDLITNTSFNVPVQPCNNSNAMPEQTNEQEHWVGIATEEDPKLVVCLSPTQKNLLDSTKKIPDEATNLLDLHNKFIERRSYNEDIININPDNVNSDGEVTNTLLAIIQDPGSSKGSAPLSVTKTKRESPDMYLYYEENEVENNVKVNETFTLPRTKQGECEKNARLHARNLSEWLQLARDKSKSETHLNKNTEMKTTIATINFRRGSTSNLHESPLNTVDSFATNRRRRSLPQEFYIQQMQYLIQKEKEIQQELESLEEEKRKLTFEMTSANVTRQFELDNYQISKKGDIAIHNEDLCAIDDKNKLKSAATPSSECFRKHMYEEYKQQMAAREERKQHKVIKISTHHQQHQEKPNEKLEVTHVPGLKDEFMDKVKKRRSKYGLHSEDSGEGTSIEKSDAEDDVKEPVLVMDGGSITGVNKLPKHLKEFVDITRQAADAINEESEDGVWSPGQQQSFRPEEVRRQTSYDPEKSNEPILPVWTPKSAGTSPTSERKEFRPISFESPILGRKRKPKSDSSAESTPIEPPWKSPSTSSDVGVSLSSSLEKRIPNSYSAPASGFSEFSTPRLPRAQNPTITLLQKAREGQLPKGASYIEKDSHQYSRKHDSPPHLAPGEIIYQIKNEYISESDSEQPRRMADLGSRKFEGIGPTTKDGMPIVLRSEVKDKDYSKWYKRMYDTIHKQKPRYDDDYVTVRYKQHRGRYPYTSGYLSEPEPGAYDSDGTIYGNKFATLDRRRPQPSSDTYTMSYTMPRSSTNNYVPGAEVIKHGQDVYKNQPGRIENYIPGHSSISEKEAKEHLEQQKHIAHKGYMSQALKESGYESDSTLVFRRRDDTANLLSPTEQREVYRHIQKGGDVPLHGLRKPAPERPKDPEAPIPPPKGLHGLREREETESPRKYVENEVTIHYRTPVRQEVKEALSEDELARRQAEHMKKIYQEERRRKYLQELQDMNSRRHADNFIPSQKSPIPLNRYDDFIDDLSPKLKPRPRSPEPRLVAKALYNFVGQSARELTFRKGDIIYIRRQVDKNWYEGEHNAMVGLFPANYVEIIPYDGMKSTTRKPHEGQARAKYNFIAQTHLELSLAKGELVVITRKVDDNWYEGKIGGRKGIFPVSYVEVLIDPSAPPPPHHTKPVAAPAAHSLLLNGSAGGKESMGTHNYIPPFQNPDVAPSYHAKPVQMTGSGTYGSLHRSKNPVNQALHIDTQSEPTPYRALYKYKPQNDDELELLEGDTVYVLEKCDDGWYVGSSNRTGAFGTFPGNYVERI